MIIREVICILKIENVRFLWSFVKLYILLILSISEANLPHTNNQKVCNYYFTVIFAYYKQSNILQIQIIPVWILMCLFRVGFVENSLKHWSHLNKIFSSSANTIGIIFKKNQEWTFIKAGLNKLDDGRK